MLTQLQLQLQLLLVAGLVVAMAGFGSSAPAIASVIAEVETQPTSETFVHESGRLISARSDSRQRASRSHLAASVSKPVATPSRATGWQGVSDRREQTLRSHQVRIQI